MSIVVYTNDLGVTRAEPFGIDVSMHNGAVDMAKVRAHSPKITFAWAKTGESWGYEDPKFDEYRAGFEDDGIWFGGYHFLYPAEDPKAQVRKLIEIAGKGLDGYAWDMEIWQGQPASVVLKNLGIAVMELLNMGLPVWIYSYLDGVNRYMVPQPLEVPGWFEDVNWWIAQVFSSGREHPGPVAELRGVPREKLLIHQSSWKWRGSLIGQVGSYHLDGNRWLRGTPGNIPQVEIPEPETPPIIVDKTKIIQLMTVQIPVLRMRSGPGTGYAIVGSLTGGKVVEVLETRAVGADTWVRVGQGQWSASKYNGQIYLA